MLIFYKHTTLKKLNGYNMIVLCYGWFFFLIFSTLFIVAALVIEKNFDECHPVKKWWRRNVIGWDPEYPRPDDDCNE